MSWKTLTYQGWGRVLTARGRVARPERQSTLRTIVNDGAAPAFGQRRSYGDAALNSDGKALDMTRVDRILSFDHETGIIEVEAGLSIGDLSRIYASQGWIPAVTPGTGFATIGGCIANDVHGKNHHHLGSFGQHVTQITLLQGGVERIVTAQNDLDLFKATIGGLGQTGVIASAKLQMIPCKGASMRVSERRIETLADFLTAFDETDAPYSVGWIDATAKGEHLGRGIFEEGEITSAPPSKDKKPRSILFNAPPWALCKLTVKLFNAAYFRRIPAAGRTRIKPIFAPFFPLDAVRNWNRLYGKKGFHQFQCVVPLAAADTLHTILTQISYSGLASPLAVIKKMGSGRTGYMSFPMEGYTLAVDFPNGPKALELIASLTDQVAASGGRIYFAKDSTATAGQVDAMYPERSKWRDVISLADPSGALKTDLVRRLNLRDTPSETSGERR
jgi:decaprenylphospho-beta-D-ribofuranose 2-oxidase